MCGRGRGVGPRQVASETSVERHRFLICRALAKGTFNSSAGA